METDYARRSEESDYLLNLVSKTHFYFLIRAEEHLKQIDGASEITPGIRNFLVCLFSDDGLKISDAAKKMGVGKSTMTSVVSRAKKMGYITTTRDPKDGRAIRVYLTEKAHKFRPPLIRLGSVLNQEINQILSKEDQKSLEELLEKLLSDHPTSAG
ncbi:MAG: MarR family winged helix-turn-helix transcriptional regulator [Verrucomicrobiota bacterium]